MPYIHSRYSWWPFLPEVELPPDSLWQRPVRPNPFFSNRFSIGFCFWAFGPGTPKSWSYWTPWTSAWNVRIWLLCLLRFRCCWSIVSFFKVIGAALERFWWVRECYINMWNAYIFNWFIIKCYIHVDFDKWIVHISFHFVNFSINI